MYKRILVPLDGSPFAEEALPLARLLAVRFEAELHFAHVIQAGADFGTPQEDLEWRAYARDASGVYLARHAEEARAAGASVVTVVLEGAVAPALEAYAADRRVDLMLLTTHGRGGLGRFWLGSVADQLLRGSEADVFMVRPWDETVERARELSRFETILVPLDGSEESEVAVPSARWIADRFGASLVLTRVVPSPVELTSIYGVPGVELRSEADDERLREAKEYLSDLSARVESERVEVRVAESPGAAEGVVEAARATSADLVVLASHGRGGLERAVLGSVADKIVRATTRPVLVVRRQVPKGSKV